MGLDMYFFARKTKEEKAQARVLSEDPDAVEEIGYFRKFHDLNNFLGTLYPPGIEDFNCEGLDITPEILKQIEDWAYAYSPDSEWGKEDGDDLQKTVIPAIKNALAEGRPVYYVPWW